MAESDPEDYEALAEEFADLPSTDIEVLLHVHFGMTGSFPLRLSELFFADDGVYIVEYSYITPLFGLGTKRHHRDAQGMQAIYDTHGLDEVILQGDRLVWLNYEEVDFVVLHEGGRFGRPKLTVYAADGTSWAYRLHDEAAESVDLQSELERLAERFGFDVKRRAGTGFHPQENLLRFFRN